MATQLLNVTKTLQKLTINSTYRLTPTLIKTANNNLPTGEVILGNSTRNTNFFNKLPAQNLWKGITSVSNAGRKRGRAKNVSTKNIKDLNRGQIIGVGKANMVWPGLSAPIIRGKELVLQQQLPEDPEREQKLIQLRDQMGSFRYTKLSPIERGWSGTKLCGRSIGAPDPVGENTFEGFDSKVLEMKSVFNMKGNFGRKRRISVIVVTGNSNGLAGFALGKGIESKTAIRKAKNRSAQKLMHIKLFRGHTVFHDFFTQYGQTKIFVNQKPEGYGLVAHRAIRTMCEVIGIKNIYAKVEGSTNVNHIIKAFFLGLIRQKTHEEIAQEKGLHVVELCKENDYFPNVVASPTVVKREQDLDKLEQLDYHQYCFDGRVVYKKKKMPPFYAKYKSYEIYLKKQEKRRNQDEAKKNLIAEYGEIRSFMADKYPECTQYRLPKKEQDEEQQVE